MGKEMLWGWFLLWVGTGIVSQIAFGYFNPFNVSVTAVERISYIEGAVVGWVGHAIARRLLKPERGVETP